MHVPRLSQAILRLVCRDDVGRDIVADLAEEFAAMAGERGRPAARRWYRRQVAWSIAARALAGGRWLLRALALAAATLCRGLDLGPAIRSLRRAPWFAATVIGVMALSIALAATVFAVVDGVLFKPLPYADVARLVVIQPVPDRGWRISREIFERWDHAMEDVVLTALRIDEATGLERLNESGLGIAHVRANLLEVLGVRAFLGGFSDADRAQAALPSPPVRPVLITYHLWQQRFGGEIDAIGQIVPPVDPMAAPIRIAGVLPPDFVLPGTRPAHLLMPSLWYAEGGRRQTLLARLPDGLSADAFRARAELALGRVVAAQPDGGSGANAPDRIAIAPIRDGLSPWERQALGALFAAVALLVLVACVNASGLMTARALDRGRDIGLRRAIGARTRDVVALLLSEHVLLFGAGAAAGLAAAVPCIRLVTALLPPEIQLFKLPTFDGRVVAFAALAMAVTFGVSAVWPIRRALKMELQPAIGAHGGGQVTRRTSSAGTRIVIALQVAGTIVLVVGGGLLVASLIRVKGNDTGYQTDGVIISELGVAPWLDGKPGWNRRPDVKVRLAAFLESMRTAPGVAAAGAADVSVLIGSVSFASRFDPVGAPPDPRHAPGTISVGDAGGLRVPVTSGFFAGAGIVAIDGRLPTDRELDTGAPVAVISRSYARRHFPGGGAVGQRLRHTPAEKLPTFEIVGVVDDPRLMRWDAPVSSAVFVPYALFGGDPDPVLFVRAGGPMAAVMTEIVARADAERPFLRPVRVQAAAVMLGDTIRSRRLQSWLFGSLAAAGLVVAGVGLLGLAAMAMARRTREIGIRMAIGATRDRVVAGLVREQVIPVAVGLAGGLLVAAWAVGFVEAYLYELSVYDARVWIAAVVIVSATALIGALVPSLRASRVDPVRALRVE